MQDKYDISDLIVSSIEQKPDDFEHAFKDILLDKISAAVDAKRIEVAQNMFNREVEHED